MSTPWTLGNMYTLSHAKVESDFPSLQNGDLSAKGENPERKTSIIQDCCRVVNPTQK
jgi:hypothetical protein